MTSNREDLRDELLAMVRAGRELPAASTEDLVDNFLHDAGADLLKQQENTPSPVPGASGRRGGEWVKLGSGIASALCGLTALVYLLNSMRLAAIGNFFGPHSSTDISNLTASTLQHGVVLMLVPVVVFALTVAFHAVHGGRRILILLALSTAVVVVDVGLTAVFPVFDLPAILQVTSLYGVVSPGVFTTLQVVSGVLAVVACGAAFVRSLPDRASHRRTGEARGLPLHSLHRCPRAIMRGR